MKNREMFKDQLNQMLDDNYWEGEEQRFEDVATQDIVTPFSVTKKGCLKKCEPGWRDDCNDCIFYIPLHCPKELVDTCNEECSECSFFLDFTEKTDCLVALKKWLDSEYKMVVHNWDADIDWRRVPTDTPVLVKKSGMSSWQKRNFCRKENGKYITWEDGSTSWTIKDVENDIERWDSCHLARPEDVEKYRGV